ncbi:hypothetical protein Tco_1425169 [Tanacetum coccineum]
MRSILEKEKLNGSNFLDWYRNLRIILRNEQKLHHLEEALPEAPPATATSAVRNAYTRRVAEQQEVACLMLVSITPEIQKNLEDCTAFEILQELKTIFQQQVEQELFETVKAFHACKQEEGQSVSTYDCNMHGMGKTILELHAMLKLAEKSIPKKALAVLDIRQELKKNKASTSGTSGLRGYRKLNKGALDLYVGNGNTVVVEAIGSFDLILPSGMILVLDNCHFSPTITRGVISL